MGRMAATDVEGCVKPAPLAVIIAEKHPLVRAAFATLLSYDGYRVFQADSSKAAISLIDSIGSVAVLLADLDMPDWRLIVHHAVQQTDALIIVMGEHPPISNLHDLKARGIRLYLQKPINYGDLQMGIWKELGLRQPPKLVLNKGSSANQQQRTAIG